MATPNSIVVSCPNCSNRFSGQVEQIIDVYQNPNAKSRFLAGQVNMQRCPNCEFVFQVGTPLVYHDPHKDLLLIYVPMELNMHRDEEEMLVGRLTRAITDSLPMEMRKGYLLNPRRTFTMQGMIDSVLEADGITKQMIEERRQKMELVRVFLEANPDDLEALAKQYDAELNENFFQLLTAVAEIAINNRDQATAERLLMIRDVLLQFSSFGKEVLATSQRQEQTIQKVAEDLNKLGRRVSQETLLELLVRNVEDDDYVQAFVGMTRPALDYNFLQMLSDRAEEARNSKVQRRLTDLRDKVVELTTQLDAHRQALIQQSSQVLQDIANSPDIERAIIERTPFINEVFLSVLEANLEDARKRGDEATLQRLQEVYEILMRLLQQSAPPEVQFINELLKIEDPMERRLSLVEKAPEFGPELLVYMDTLITDLNERGPNPLIERLVALRDETQKVLAE